MVQFYIQQNDIFVTKKSFYFLFYSGENCRNYCTNKTENRWRNTLKQEREIGMNRKQRRSFSYIFFDSAIEGFWTISWSFSVGSRSHHFWWDFAFLSSYRWSRWCVLCGSVLWWCTHVQDAIWWIWLTIWDFKISICINVVPLFWFILVKFVGFWIVFWDNFVWFVRWFWRRFWW